MFFLTRKKDLEKQRANESFQEARQSIVFEKLPLFYEFEYLGLTLRVTHHIAFAPALCEPYIFMPGQRAEIICEYVDKNDIIHTKKFSLKQCEYIIEQLKDNR